MRATLVAILFFLFNNSWASDFSIIVCDPLASAEVHLRNQSETNEESQLLVYRGRIQNFIKNAQNSLESSLKINDTASVAITCGMVDDATLGFTRPCYSDSGEVLNLKIVEKLCKDIANK